ncbi:MAG: PASTA domain-containing protein [Actinomycetota bacterium]
MEIAENQVLDGRYRVLSRIGSGGMADVFCAEDTHLQRKVALKVLHHRFAQDREFVERFRREAEAAAGLQHPNVVGVFDRGEVDGTYYIAMEYLEGRSLKELIDAGLERDEAVAIVRQILEAARFAHRHGVVHRDLKPLNVIVDPEAHATVTDFGIARAGVSEITQTGSVMGTAHYLSPEQAQGLEVTAASDLYSIGVILYEALTSRLPFEGDSAVAVALKQVSQSPQRPSAINPQVSPAVDAVVMRALEKSPERRFRDAEAFIAALDAAQRDPGTTRASDTAAFAPLPPVEAPEEAAAGGVPPSERDEEERRHRWMWVALAILGGLLFGIAVATGLIPERKTNVPNVTNPLGTRQTLNSADLRLRSEGFEIAKVEYVHRDLPRNTVIEQDPPPGEAELDCILVLFSCDKPSVTLTVSSGPGKAEVPQLAGLAQEDAASRLKRAGFAPAVETQSSDTVPEGIVIASDPPSGSVVRRGSLVTLKVSTGPRQVKVPVVVGEQRSVATEEIRSRGLVPSVQQREDDAPEGEVVSQSPSAGTRVESGSTVTIAVSRGPKTVTVPNVIGKLRSNAVSILRGRGFSVTVSVETTEDESQDGRVISQFPSAGSDAAKGSAVTITVGDFVPPPEPPTTTTTPTTPTPTPRRR